MKSATSWKQKYTRRFRRAPIDERGVRDSALRCNRIAEEDTVRPSTLLALSMTIGAALLAGCAMQPVQAWEKGDLAKPAMSFSVDTLDDHFTQHIYNSKENASGGYGAGGGGCGCN
jgi:hypothetical protein